MAGLLVLVGLLDACLETPRAAGIHRTRIAAVERVSDGDTVIATTANGTTLRIRLPGIDAGEGAPTATPRMVWEGGCRRC